jgi:hypothetical protein
MRNQIMDYALFELGGLHYRSDLGGIDRLYPNLDLVTKNMRHPHAFEANQVKYVCRQLYHKTKGRVLEYIHVLCTKSKIFSPPSAKDVHNC